MCSPTLVVMGVMAVSGGVQAYGQVQEGKSVDKMYQYKAALARQNAELTRKQVEAEKIAVGETAESNITATQGAAAEESKRLASSITVLTGAQKATIGALGIGGVTAADIAESTFDKARLDQLAIRYNANVRSYQFKEQAKQDIWRTEEEAKSRIWALGSEATQYEFAGKSAKRAGKTKAFGTLLSTAATVGMTGLKFGGGGYTGSGKTATSVTV